MLASLKGNLLRSYCENCLFGKPIKGAYHLYGRVLVISLNACKRMPVRRLRTAGHKELQAKAVGHFYKGRVFCMLKSAERVLG